LPKLTLGGPRAAVSLLLAGSTALIGAQQVLDSAADAPTTQALLDVHDFQPLPVSTSVAVPQMVTAAASTGQFEETLKPTAVPTVAATPEPVAPMPEAAAPISVPSESAVSLYESGIASTYGEGDGFEGRLTACGQIFHTDLVQIAHKTLPCGTNVRVEDTSSGRTVDAQVTDRGPYVPGRVVDLSWAAFRKLHPAGPGLLRVNVYLMDP
jgi:rare lipoprotein A (peptidoglycan hydrolase)